MFERAFTAWGSEVLDGFRIYSGAFLMFRTNFIKSIGGRADSRWLMLLSSCAIILPLNAHAQTGEEAGTGTMLKPITLQAEGSAVGPDSTIVAKSSRRAPRPIHQFSIRPLPSLW